MSDLVCDILGAGSLGLALAGRLSAAPRTVVRLLTHTPGHAEKLSASGFMLRHGDAETRVRLPASAAAYPSSANVLVVAVKCHQTAQACRQFADAAGRETLVITLQNGLGADALLRLAFPEHVCVGLTRLGAHVTATGVNLVSVGQTLVGPAPAGFEPTRTAFLERLRAAGLPAQAADPIEPHVWRKLLINAAINAPAALGNLRNGEWIDRPGAAALIRDVLAEALAVAGAAGVAGVFADVASAAAEVAAVARNTAGNVNSMLADRRAGRPTEIDFINGALCALGAECGIPTPVNATLAALVRAAGPVGDVPVGVPHSGGAAATG